MIRRGGHHHDGPLTYAMRDTNVISFKKNSGLVVSMFTTGAFFGAAFAGPVGDWLGRRGTIAVGSAIFCLGGGLQTGAQTLAYLYSGRFFAGFAYVSFFGNPY
jgi:MFS family permease